MKKLIVFLLAFAMVAFSSVNAEQEISKDALVEDASQLFIELILHKALGARPQSAFEILSESYDESQLNLLCDEGSPLCPHLGNGGATGNVGLMGCNYSDCMHYCDKRWRKCHRICDRDCDAG